MIWKLNGFPIENDPRKLPAIILGALPDLKFRSVEALQELYRGVTALSLEMAKLEQKDRKGGQRAILTRYINRNKEHTKLPSEHEKLLKVLYEKILVAEGLGRLHGFGFSNKWGDKLRGNSEYGSVKPMTYFKQKQKRMEESKMKRSELVKAAKELNEVLGLDPQIDVKEKPEALTALIKEAAGLIDPELDDLTDSTLSVIAEITKEKGGESKKIEKEKVVEKKEETAEEEEFKESKEAIKVAKDAEKKENVKKNTKTSVEKEKTPSPIKKVGVISTIVEAIEKSGKKGITKKEIHDILVKKFPDRSEKGMERTINVQVPNRISKEKFKLESLENSRYRKADI